MKRKLSFGISLIFCLCLGLSFGLSACKPKGLQISFDKSVKNLVMFIGDGMGFNQIANSKTYFEKDKYSFDDYYVCPVTTYSKSDEITDSAAAATALATGHKANNGEVSRNEGVDFEHLMSIAQRNGKKTGIITSDRLFGATPACYSSHANNRGKTQTIIECQLQSGIDVLIGETEASQAYNSYHSQFASQGYDIANDANQFFQMQTTKKILANFPNMKSLHNSTMSDQADFVQIVTKVLSLLDNPNGFCLMIEDAYVDKYSHSNQIFGAICEVYTVSDIFEALLGFCSNRKDTVIVLTADHETGGLQKAESKEQVTNELYTRPGHSSADVPLYLKGISISGYGEKIDNTDVFEICKKVVENKK